jgi:hypothetical protein
VLVGGQSNKNYFKFKIVFTLTEAKGGI